MIKRGLTLVNAQHITASVFINYDESGLHQDCEVWIERLAPHAPIDQAGPEAAGPGTGGHNRTGEDAVLNKVTGTPAPREAGVGEDYRGVLGSGH